ncbi:hypothetical protein [uncultured Helicobacter sp.]|nr:hypothetical protein [uncultured Helicobacter sp.]
MQISTNHTMRQTSLAHQTTQKQQETRPPLICFIYAGQSSK